MQRILTAAAIIGGMALSTSGLALAQSSTAPSYAPPSSTSPSMTNPGTTNPDMTRTPGATNPSGMNHPSRTTGPSAANTPSGAAGINSPQNIRQAQEQLRAKGLYHGPIDGQMGPETKAALAQFQQQNGLPHSSSLDQATLAKLNNASGGAGNATENSGSSTPPASMNPTMNPSTGGSSNPTMSPKSGVSPALPHAGSSPGSTTPGEATRH
ncbi:MAG: peptidoglycan-binding domain-containing protein [Stellaceae bacterium]